MDLFLQYLANGVVVGSSYVLVAVGLTLIFGILHVVNFAHGEFYMLGGYAGITASTAFGLPLPVSLAVVAAVSCLLGLGAEALLHRGLKNQDQTSSIIASFGLAVALQNAVMVTMGPQPELMHTELAYKAIELGPVFLPAPRALIPPAMLIIVGALFAALRWTWTGRSLRAMAQHETVARLCGVKVRRVAVITFMLGATLAGVAGFMMSAVYMVHPLVGNMIVLKAFIVVIIGGMGSPLGAAAAGLLLGVIESMTSAYLTNGLRDVVGFLLVIAVLLFRPQGLFGRSLERS
ncbi:MAG: branched-chain amino acid ABC transporter permease [Rhodobacteraceae bacterium]|nr:branched-chain amino acid ABC transporter permease [Paracoccaceae bacterium]MBR25360.1 branched-chain amino acid ABC transporter permease [Paracoccaceae bacterium]